MERKRENENDIMKFRKEQNIGFFLNLVERFLDDSIFLVKTLEVLNEDKVDISN